MDFLWRCIESLARPVFFMYGYQVPVWDEAISGAPQERDTDTDDVVTWR